MTICTTTYVVCDRCAKRADMAISIYPSGLRSKALQLAKRAGWSRNNRAIFQDLCPECLKTIQKGGEL